MNILGIPKEIKTLEKRVGMTPAGVDALSKKGYKIVVQSGAGEGSSFSDEAYRAAGAELVPEIDDVYARASLIQKVKEPQPAEFPLIDARHTLFCFLHLASPENCALLKVLVATGAAGLAYETLEKDGRLPLLAPMSEIAGGLSAAYGTFLKHRPSASGAELSSALQEIAAHYPDFTGLQNPGRVVVWGGGVAGQKAAEAALRMNAEVSVVEKSEERRKQLVKSGAAVFGPEESLSEVFSRADIWIGSVHVRGARALKVMTGEQLKSYSARKNKVIMDISIDQGGNFPESRATTYQNAVYRDSCGNVRFCVANIPSLCGRAASEALAAASLPYTEMLLREGLPNGAQRPELSRALNVQGGRIMLPGLEEAHKGQP